MRIRRLSIICDVIYEEGGLPAFAPATRVAACGVIANPYAGQAADDLEALIAAGAEIGEKLAKEALALLPGPAIAYGKAAIVGVNGDIEHAAAILHPRMGKAIRAAIGGGRAVIPSTQKIGAAGAAIDTPLGHKDDAWSFNHIDTINVSIGGAPRPDEIPHRRCAQRQLSAAAARRLGRVAPVLCLQKGENCMPNVVLIPKGSAPPLAPYSPGVRADRTIYVSGTVPMNSKGETIGVGDVKAQTRAVLESIKAVLEAGGCKMSDIAFNTIVLKDMADYRAMNVVYSEYFPKDPPARYCIVAGLVRDDFLVEIASIAHV